MFSSLNGEQNYIVFYSGFDLLGGGIFYFDSKLKANEYIKKIDKKIHKYER